MFEGVYFTGRDERFEYEEERFITIGHLDTRLVVLVWTPRDKVRRIISMRKQMTEKKRSTKAIWRDPDDAPELTAEFFKSADLFEGAKLKARGRPKSAMTKEAVKLRLDADVLAALRASGDGWQTRINDTLRASLKLAGRV